MTYDQLTLDDVFCFKPESDSDCAWEYRGNGFFGRGWTGGPYYVEQAQRATLEVFPLIGGRCPECYALAGPSGCSVANNTTACSDGLMAA